VAGFFHASGAISPTFIGNLIAWLRKLRNHATSSTELSNGTLTGGCAEVFSDDYKSTFDLFHGFPFLC
jgi:hypothetical protein